MRHAVDPGGFVPFQGELLDFEAVCRESCVPREALGPILRVLDIYCDGTPENDEFGVLWRIADAFEHVVDALDPDYEDPWAEAEKVANPTPPTKSPRAVLRDPIPKDLRRDIYERDDYRCVQCGDRFDITLDHIIPVVAGGPTTHENLRVLCRPCNSRKGAKIETAEAGGVPS